MNTPVPAEFLDRLADAAAGAIMPHFRTRFAVEHKGGDGFDPVTAADLAAEEAIRALIASAFPEHGIVGEELPAVRADAESVWVLDPIDGTRAFISGLPLWGVLIGLLSKGRPVLGMMAQPFTGERYAGDGTKAWYTGPGGPRNLATRPCEKLADATLFTTSPFLFTDDELPAYRRVEAGARLTRYGCDCYAYAMLAAGHADVVVEAGLKPYDIVALIPLIEGAGGKVSTWDGGSAAGGGRIVAAGDPRLHDEVLELLRT
jgi:histidinol phosphatase-like enzyme (inositol monophosphatase family)